MFVLSNAPISVDTMFISSIHPLSNFHFKLNHADEWIYNLINRVMKQND